MTILVVDNFLNRLHELAALMKEAFPGGNVWAYQDPLMAGKFSFNHHVDMLFTELVMKRMNGLEMSVFVRRTSPDATVYLIATREEYDKNIVLEDDGVNGQLIRPVTPQMLFEIAATKPGGSPPSKMTP